MKRVKEFLNIDHTLLTILTLSLVAGQLLKVPLTERNGIVSLDIATALFTFWLILKSKFKFKKPPLFISLAVIFFAVGFISVLISPAMLSLNQEIISISYGLRFLLYILFGYFIYNTSLKNISQKLFIISGLGLATLGLIQLIFLPNLIFLAQDGWDPHYFRTVSTLLDPNFAGAFFGLTLLILFINFRKSKFYILAFLLVFVALLTTFSRGAYLFFFISFMISSILLKSWQKMVLTLLLCFFLYVGFIAYTNLVAVPRNIDRNQSAEFRVSSWAMGYELFQKSPIFGVGFNSYRFSLEHFKIAPDEFTKARGGSTNDSSLLHALVTTGIIGFIIYLLFIFSILKKSLLLAMSKNKVGVLVFAGLTGLIAQSFFSNTLFYPWFLLWIILSAIQLEES